ncbi:MAG: uroporphyrinogen-III C-methyltransferase [Clostridiales bacterium]
MSIQQKEDVEGKVYLVGAGPGDPELITVKGLRILAKADVLIYDRLSSPQLLAEVPDDCEKIYVGKAAANHALPQDEINELIYQKALAGGNIVRLKGGDPYVFGRGGEEILYLMERGILAEVIPGITSAIAGPASAGIPVTHRDWVSSFHVFTGNFRDSQRALDFPVLAALNGTLIFLMGLGNLPYIVQGLLQEGKDGKIPAAIISNATMDNQKSVYGTLAELPAMAEAEGIISPAITIIGDVVNCRAMLEKKINFK